MSDLAVFAPAVLIGLPFIIAPARKAAYVYASRRRAAIIVAARKRNPWTAP